MKAKEIIKTLNEEKVNEYSDERKLEWISELDGTISEDLIGVINPGTPRFRPYKSMDANVIGAERYKQMYIEWLKAQIDKANDENERYNSDIAMFNTAYSQFERAYIREHRATSRSFSL